MSDEKMREAFEAWAWENRDPHFPDFSKDESGDKMYWGRVTEIAWQAWQAAQRQGGEAVAYAVIDDDEIIEVQESKGDAEYLAQQEGGRVVPLYGKSTSQPAVPEGWKLVPVEPTKKMREAFHAADDEYQSAKFDVESPDHHWTALLEAAPEPQEDV